MCTQWVLVHHVYAIMTVNKLRTEISYITILKTQMPLKVQLPLPTIGQVLYQLGVHIRAKKIKNSQIIVAIKYNNHFSLIRAVVVVKWSAYLLSTPTNRVRMLLKPSVFSGNFLLEKSKINKKKSGLIRPLVEKSLTAINRAF